MDVGELLSFQILRGFEKVDPDRFFHVVEEDDESSLNACKKLDHHLRTPDKPSVLGLSAAGPSTSGLKRKRRLEDTVKGDEVIREKKPSVFREETEKVAAVLEEDASEIESVDELSLKRLILQFEKKVSRNQEMRIKFPDLPEKFMESEVELNDIIQEMHVIATVPDLYHIVVELNAVQSLLQLLSHENTDVAIAVVDLLQEMTDVDSLNDSDEGADILIDALLAGQVLALLVQNMERLDESVKEESDGIHNSLAILENMTEIRPEVSIDATQQGFMQWLLKRIKAKMPFDENRLYCSELLSILVQTHQENRQTLGELEGIDVLLSQLAMYKRHDPSTAEEVEFMENLFNALCSSLMLPANRARFLKGEGLQLMNLMLREKKMSKTTAIKVLDHAMIGPEGVDNCNKFIDILGLRSLFPLFMKSPAANRKAGPNKQELEEHVVSILASLVKNCDGTQRQRLLNKFVENDHEKVDRLMELHFKYLEKVHGTDERIEKQKREVQQRGEEITDEMEEQYYMSRLEAGLFTLQLLDYIMLEMCHSCTSSVRQRVLQIINMRGGSIKTIKSIMREYAGSIGDADNHDVQKAEQERILQLVDRF